MIHASTSEQLARINPDSKPVLYLVLAVTTVIAAVAFAVSFAGLAAVSQWAQIPPRLAWALPVFIDGAILGFTIMILVFRARGESTIFAWVVLIAFTLVSIAANGAHAYAEGTPGDWRTILGSGLAGLAPAGLAVFIHGIARLLVAVPSGSTSELSTEQALPQDSNVESPKPRGKPADVSSPLGLTSFQSGSAEVEEQSKTLTVVDDNFAGNVVPSIPERAHGGTAEQGGGSAFESIAKATEPKTSRAERISEAGRLRSQGKTQVEISKVLGVSRATVGRWLKTHNENANADDKLNDHNRGAVVGPIEPVVLNSGSRPPSNGSW